MTQSAVTRPTRQINIKLRNRLILFALLAIGTALTLLVSGVLSRAESVRTAERIRLFTQGAVNALQLDLARSVEAIRVAGLMIESNPQLTQVQFNRHMQKLVENQLNINLVEWQPIVPSDKLEQFEAAARSAGQENYRVVQPDTSGTGWEFVHGRDEYVPVLFAWPEQYRTAGLDMSFSPQRMASKLQSRELRQPVASGVFEFIKEGKVRSGTSALAISTAVFGNENAAIGYLAAVVDLPTLFQSAIRLADSAKFDVLAFASATPASEPIFIFRGNDSDLKEATAGLRSATAADSRATVDFAHQSWELVLHPRPAFYAEANQNGSRLAFLTGAGATLLLALILSQLQVSRARTAHAESLALSAQQAQQDLAQQLMEAQRIACVGSWQMEVGNGEIVWSDELYRMYGLPPESPVPDFAESARFFTPESWDRLSSQMARTLETGAPYELELEMIKTDGSYGWMLARGEAVQNESGAIVSVRGITADITERKQAMISLAASEQRFRDMVNTTDGIVWEADAQTFTFTFISEKAEKLLGFPTEDWYQPGFWVNNLHPDDKSWAPEYCASCTGRLEPHDFEYRFVAKDGRTIWLHDIVTVVSENNAPRWLRGIMIDISARKALEAELDHHRRNLEHLVDQRTAELNQAKESAEAANIAKSTFLANMSHEIRTPMNAITGMVHLLRRGGVTPVQADRLDKIENASNHLLEIINAILDLSKIEAGKLSLEETRISIAQMFEDIASMGGEKLKAKGVAFKLEASQLPESLLGDRTRIQQALLNYVINAIKFTERGCVTLRADTLEDAPDSALIRFEVEDTGIGIAPEAIPRLFSAFEQADNSITRQYGGTGLGLAITRRIAELMGGEAGVRSTLGKGSTFWLTVRLKKADIKTAELSTYTPADAERALKTGFSGTRVLLAEDEPINREITLSLLEDVELRVDVAEDGEQAIKLVRDHDYSLILMDMQMPKMDGLEATRQIRQLSDAKRIPILAMTANAFVEDKAKCLEAGMDDFVAKPAKPEHLYAVILAWLGKHPST